MATWKEDIIKALENLGGVAHRSKIHEEVSKIREGNLNNTWTQTIQRELETYSSDSDAYAGKEDLFFMSGSVSSAEDELTSTTLAFSLVKTSSKVR